MAKKKKRVPAKKKEEAKKNKGFWHSVWAVVLIVGGVVLAFGAFIKAPIPHGFWHGAWVAFGAAAVMAPLALMYLGLLKLLDEDRRMPFPNLAGMLGLLVFLAGFFYSAFVQTAADGTLAGGHGGAVGKAVGGVVVGAMGKFLASLVFFLLSVFAMIFAFGIEPRSLLELFRREPKEGEEDEEDLAALNKKMGNFQLNEGVPVEHHPPSARLASFRNSAQKLAPEQEHAALTTTSDPDWQFPSINLLSDKQDKADAGNVTANAETIKETFANFNIDVDVEGANVGPRVTQYTLKPPTGVKLAKLTGLENNLALDLAAHSIRMEAPIPGKRAVGVEVPNVKAATVTIHGLLSSDEWRESKGPLTFAIGKDITGVPVVGNLDTMPHLLVAGQTGSGKSVMINTLLTSLLYRNTPSDLKLILVDPKQVEMALYHDIPHLLSPVITEPEKCISALKWAVAEMERRLKAFAEVGKRNIGEYNELKQEEGMPYIVIVIDELADLMMMAARDVEALVVRLAQKARAAGIHLVIATQRPSVDVITGLIKANIPARIAFTVVSQVDSRTIIDRIGAEKLLGRGDLLFNIPEFMAPKRVQGALIIDTEINKVCDFLRAQRPPNYDEEVVSQPVQIGKGGVVTQMDDEENDDMFKDAVSVVATAGKASTSLLQRKLRIGYGRASRIMDIMEERGIIGPADGAKPRQVLVSSADEVFGGQEEPNAAPQQQPTPMSAEEEGDIYDEIPEEEI